MEENSTKAKYVIGTEDTKKEFQNLLAIRGQLVTLLVATTGGTVWLINLDTHSGKHIALIAIGIIFVANLIKSIQITNFKIKNLITKRK